ncbi:palmitoyltransferase [Elysia marginata]|uniref:Palmitoyltransferase n=1 Tax=Elysia marginata TaxID=1093978 RepID=A0AAV4ESB6_9GAST|nr:palmitoyltransferase [Elysia marginata]
MNWKAETVLRIISAICQFYYASYSAASLYFGMTLTIPVYASEDAGLRKSMTFLMWFIFLNMMGNFFCIIYKARLSIVKPKSNAAIDLPGQAGIFRDTWHDYSSPASASGNEQQDLQSNSVDLLHQKENYLNNNCNDSSNFAMSSHSALAYNPSNFDTGADFAKSNDQIISHGERSDVEILGGWRKCKDCFVLTPPRGKHCPLCKHCVLKRDHHCYFVGHCIGFHNQRFFVCFCLYGGLGGLYSLWLTSSYLRANYDALQTWGLLAYMGPFALVHWALGYTSGANLGMVMFWWWSFVTSAMGSCYFLGQITLVKRGQTKWEFFQDKFPYQGTLTENIQSVFGKFWPICFLIPAPFLGYVGDGANWDDLTGLKSL